MALVKWKDFTKALHDWPPALSYLSDLLISNSSPPYSLTLPQWLPCCLWAHQACSIAVCWLLSEVSTWIAPSLDLYSNNILLDFSCPLYLICNTLPIQKLSPLSAFFFSGTYSYLIYPALLICLLSPFPNSKGKDFFVFITDRCPVHRILSDKW